MYTCEMIPKNTNMIISYDCFFFYTGNQSLFCSILEKVSYDSKEKKKQRHHISTFEKMTIYLSGELQL